jgi:hypothetical protein
MEDFIECHCLLVLQLTQDGLPKAGSDLMVYTIIDSFWFDVLPDTIA